MTSMYIDPSTFINLGLGAFISVYLVYYITSKLNSKLDRLIDKLDKLNISINNLLVRINDIASYRVYDDKEPARG